jgi:hypothetical protein
MMGLQRMKGRQPFINQGKGERRYDCPEDMLQHRQAEQGHRTTDVRTHQGWQVYRWVVTPTCEGFAAMLASRDCYGQTQAPGQKVSHPV